MIELKPSKAIVAETNLDFNLISYILSRFIQTKRKIKLKIYKSNSYFSAFYVGKNVIRINLKENNTLKYYISTLLHEIRHYLQVKNVSNKILFQYANYIEYFTSPEEKDARKFEKLAADVCKIYNCYKKIDEKILKFNLDSFKELEYT